MESAADFVGAFVELSARMEHCHYHFKGRLVELCVHIYGDSASVVLHGDAFVLVDGHLDVGAIACHRLVDGVVHGLVHEVVESLFADVADVHCRAFAHCFKSFEHLNVAG